MANTHNVVTVTPYIPAHLVNEAELDILHQVGFDYVMLRDKAGQMAYSFYAEQGMDPEAGFNANDPPAIPSRARTGVPQQRRPT